ncbi:MAG: hypothetical protein ACTSWY_06125 [Promethearchaeota archaeon]
MKLFNTSNKLNFNIFRNDKKLKNNANFILSGKNKKFFMILWIFLAIWILIQWFNRFYYGQFIDWDDRAYYSYLSRAYTVEGIMHLQNHYDNFINHSRIPPFLVFLFTGIRLFTGEIETDYYLILFLLFQTIIFLYCLNKLTKQILSELRINTDYSVFPVLFVALSPQISVLFFMGYAEISSMSFLFTSMVCFNEFVKKLKKFDVIKSFEIIFFATLSWWTRMNMLVCMIGILIIYIFLVIYKLMKKKKRITIQKNNSNQLFISKKFIFTSFLLSVFIALIPFLAFIYANNFTWYTSIPMWNSNPIDKLGIELLPINLVGIGTPYYFSIMILFGTIYFFIYCYRFLKKFINEKWEVFSILVQKYLLIFINSVLALLYFLFWITIHMFLPYEFAFTSGRRYFIPNVSFLIIWGFTSLVYHFKKREEKKKEISSKKDFKFLGSIKKKLKKLKLNKNNRVSNKINIIMTVTLIFQIITFSVVSIFPGYLINTFSFFSKIQRFHLPYWEKMNDRQNDFHDYYDFKAVKWADDNLPVNASIVIPSYHQNFYRVILNDRESRLIYGPMPERDYKVFEFYEIQTISNLTSKLHYLQPQYIIIDLEDINRYPAWGYILTNATEFRVTLLYSIQNTSIYLLNEE